MHGWRAMISSSKRCWSDFVTAVMRTFSHSRSTGKGYWRQSYRTLSSQSSRSVDITLMSSASITVDDQPLPAEKLGLKTVGQVLAHVQKENRLVVHVLIDGQEPDLEHLSSIKQSLLHGHTLYIETAEPREMALEVLDEVEWQLEEADRLRSEA